MRLMGREFREGNVRYSKAILGAHRMGKRGQCEDGRTVFGAHSGKKAANVWGL